MTSRFARLCLTGLLLPLCNGLYAQSPGPQPQTPAPLPSPGSQVVTPTRIANPGDDELVSLKLPDADIDTVLSALEIYTGKIILRPSQLPTAPGGYNLKITKPIPKSQAILYLETILAMNNIAVLPMGTDALKVVQLPQARVEAPQLILGSTLDMPPSSQVASKLFQLDFLRVQEFQQMLQNITNPNFGAATPLANANAILVTDTISNLQRIETLLQQVDRPSSGGMATKFYALSNGAKASDVVAKLHSILTGTIQQQLGMGTTYSADDRTNQVILITDPRQFPFFDDLIAKLDVKSDPNTRNDVIYLKHAKAADVVTVLVKIIQGQNQAAQKSGSVRESIVPNAPTPPGQPAPAPGPTVISGTGSVGGDSGTNEFSSLVTVVNDDRSNAIVVSGTVDDIRLMRSLVEKLDQVLPQVRIEAVIAEVTLDHDHASGISQLGLEVKGDKLVGFTASAATANPAWTIGNGTITRGDGTTIVSGKWDLAGILTLTSSPLMNNTVVLSTPTVTTSHAKEATFISSEQRPIITGTLQTPGLSTTAGFSTSQQISQEDIGITLKVTPLIGSDGSVQMDIDADVRDVAGNVTVNGNDQPIISHRETKSTVTARSGDIIVIGGMQRHKDSKSRSRLGGIPIIGDLLGARVSSQQRTELVFFLRPYVLTNTAADNVPVINRVRQLPAKDVPQKDDIMKALDPNYVPPPKKNLLDRILPH